MRMSATRGAFAKELVAARPTLSSLDHTGDDRATQCDQYHPDHFYDRQRSSARWSHRRRMPSWGQVARSTQGARVRHQTCRRNER